MDSNSVKQRINAHMLINPHRGLELSAGSPEERQVLQEKIKYNDEGI